MSNNGKQGEQLFQAIMSRRKYGVNNVSRNRKYWDKDIDFLITSPTTGLTKSFEVKWDNRLSTTGNLYLELSNVHSKNGLGWWRFCEADYLAYGDAVNREFYIIPLVDLRERVYFLNLEQKRCGGDSVGLLLPLAAIKDLVQKL